MVHQGFVAVGIVPLDIWSLRNTVSPEKGFFGLKKVFLSGPSPDARGSCRPMLFSGRNFTSGDFDHVWHGVCIWHGRDLSSRGVLGCLDHP